MEPLSFVVILLFGFATGYGIKTEKCKMEKEQKTVIEHKIEGKK